MQIARAEVTQAPQQCLVIAGSLRQHHCITQAKGRAQPPLTVCIGLQRVLYLDLNEARLARLVE
jgi:hypothetical protein